MKRSAYLAIIAIAFSLSAAPLRAQDVTLHVDEASFLAAAGETQLIDFEGTVAPDNFLFLGDPGEFSAAGVVITNNSPMFLQNNNLYGTGAFLSPQQAAPQIVEIVLGFKKPAHSRVMLGTGAVESWRVDLDVGDPDPLHRAVCLHA